MESIGKEVVKNAVLNCPETKSDKWSFVSNYWI
jgi:hypothetical protein